MEVGHVKIQFDKPFQLWEVGAIVDFPIGQAELLVERKAAHIYEEPKKRGRRLGWRKDKSCQHVTTDT